jgi:secreted trypsin-like serine protease
LQLRKVAVPLCNGSPYCSQYGAFSTTAMVCAGDGSGSDACPGDSGGPLGRFINGTFNLAGITSWGPANCGFANSYGAYTRVYNYIAWIESYIPELKNRSGGTTPLPIASSGGAIIIMGDATHVQVSTLLVGMVVTIITLVFF